MPKSNVVYKGFVTVRKINGRDVVCTTNSVAFLIADPVHRVALLIWQRREAMRRRGNPRGNIIEVPAGRRDLKTSIKKLVAKEAAEEVGKKLDARKVKLVNRGVPLALSPGVLTERQWLAYYETDLSSCLKKGRSRVFGLKAHGERIHRRVVTFDQLERMTFHDMKLFALVQWFLLQQAAKAKQPRKAA